MALKNQMKKIPRRNLQYVNIFCTFFIVIFLKVAYVKAGAKLP